MLRSHQKRMEQMVGLMTRNEFRQAVFERDNYRCVICGDPAVDAHHIIERRLFVPNKRKG
jgi:5-methylcytosine-specific restriction endonuclease McrA